MAGPLVVGGEPGVTSPGRVLETDARDSADPGRPEATENACRAREVILEVGQQAESQGLTGQEVGPEAVLLDLLAGGSSAAASWRMGSLQLPLRSDAGGVRHQVPTRGFCELEGKPGAKGFSGTAFTEGERLLFAPHGLEKSSAPLKRAVLLHEDVVGFE
jgi:hypothetical protein